MTPRLPIILVAVCLFTLCALAALRHQKRAGSTDGETVVIRIAHYQLETGLRQAIDELALRYRALHPKVRVEQVPVPARLFRAWIQTQLVGGTAPDIVQLALGTEPEKLVAHFTALTDAVEEPNPYNQGTSVEGLRWRETFLDGLDNEVSYPPNLLDYYGVNLTVFTTRLLYNRRLWQELTGQEAPPADYESFIDACTQARQSSLSGHRPVTILAGSVRHGITLLEHLVASQTQRLYDRIDPIRTYRWEPTHPAVTLLRHDWSLDDPEVTSAAEMMRDVAALMQPGFATADRDEAVLRFLQGRAIMVAVGSWDARTLATQAEFPVGVMDLPRPGVGSPHARYAFSTARDRGNTHGSFGVTRASRHPAIAIDFLRFATSQPMNARFSDVSHWLPSVHGAAAPSAIAGFAPKQEGRLPGFDFKSFFLSSDLDLAFRRHLHHLTSPGGSVERWRAAMKADYPAVVRQALRRRVIELRRASQRLDARLIALRNVTHQAPTDRSALGRQLAELGLEQNEQESIAAWIEYELAATSPEGGSGRLTTVNATVHSPR